jgi:hypothetical protein
VARRPSCSISAWAVKRCRFEACWRWNLNFEMANH